MSERSKFSLNGVYRCENFAQHVEDDNFPISHIGYASGLCWSIELITETRNGSTVAFPSIYHHGKLKTQARVYLNIIKKDGSSLFETDSKLFYLDWYEECIGDDMDIEELLDEKNGYLDEGALTVEYGVQVESVEGEDGIWKFNFFDRFFDWRNQDNMISFIIRHEIFLFGHKQIIKLHSKKISHPQKGWIRVPKSFNPGDFVMCLQITHGVRPQLSAGELERIIGFASHFGFTNTVRYCEGRLIEMKEQPELKMRNFKMAVKFNMERYMIHLLIHIESAKQLVNILSKLNLEEMSSESMKAFVAKIFSL